MEVLTQNKKITTYSFETYTNHIQQLFDNGLVTGDHQSEVYLETTGMNLHRMQRIGKNIQLQEDLILAAKSLQTKVTWYVLAEGWCADASQNLPYIAEIAALSENIRLKILLRDDNPGIMDLYLTNGAKAVPKLICINDETGEEMAVWGPRPVEIQQNVIQLKKENPTIDKASFSAAVQKWYAKDKGVALQTDFLQIIDKCKK